jgi:hypothetical protein
MKDRNRRGTKGRPIIVETNHLALDQSRIRNNIVIQYDVTLNAGLVETTQSCYGRIQTNKLSRTVSGIS